MATNQMTSSQIITLSRVWAQDNDSASNYGVSTANAQTMLNTILANWLHQVLSRPQYVAASASGLTFAAGDTSKVTGGSVNYEEVEAVFQSASSSLTFPLLPPLKRVSVNDIIEMYNLSLGQTPGRSGSEWSHFAAEKTGDQKDLFRFWVYPALNATAYMTLKAMSGDTSTGGADIIDISYEHGVHVSRFLAAEIAIRNNRPDLVDAILGLVPAQYKEAMSGNALTGIYLNQLQDRIDG